MNITSCASKPNPNHASILYDMKYIWTLVVAIGISALIGGAVYSSQPKTAFVDNQRLFQAFEGKRELEARLENAAQSQRIALDSIKLQLIQLEQVAQTEQEARPQFMRLQRHYQAEQHRIEGAYQEQSRRYTEAIWKHISQYTLAYGEAHGYDYIFGTAGQGSLMYGASSRDITDEVIAYINHEYAGQ